MLFHTTLSFIFFVKILFSSNVYISVNVIFECSYLSFGWEIRHPLNMYVTRGMDGGHPKCLQMRKGGEGYHASCVRTHLHYLFSCFCLMVSCFICRNLTLPSFKKGVLFFSNEINFCCNEISFFYFKLLFRTKVSQNGFNFNQIES